MQSSDFGEDEENAAQNLLANCNIQPNTPEQHQQSDKRPIQNPESSEIETKKTRLLFHGYSFSMSIIFKFTTFEANEYKKMIEEIFLKSLIML